MTTAHQHPSILARTPFTSPKRVSVTARENRYLESRTLFACAPAPLAAGFRSPREI